MTALPDKNTVDTTTPQKREEDFTGLSRQQGQLQESSLPLQHFEQKKRETWKRDLEKKCGQQRVD